MIPVPDKPLARYQQRRLANTTLPQASLNAIALVAVYTMYGFDDIDICALTKLPPDAIDRIRRGADYGEFVGDVVAGVMEGEQEDVRAMLAQQSMKAARTLITKLDSPNGAHAIKAADSILDRAGHRPVDVHLHRVQLENTLTIRYVEPDDTGDAIDVEYEDVRP